MKGQSNTELTILTLAKLFMHFNNNCSIWRNTCVNVRFKYKVSTKKSLKAKTGMHPLQFSEIFSKNDFYWQDYD